MKVQEEVAVKVPQMQVVDLIRQVPNMQTVPKQIEKMAPQFAAVNGPLVFRRKTIREVVEKIVGVPQGYYEEQFVDFPEVVMVEPFMRGVARWLEAHAPPVDVPG